MPDEFRKAFETQAKMNAILEEIRQRRSKLIELDQLSLAHISLWEVAVKNGNGEEENNKRQLVHSLLDQSLDIRAETLQLVKKFESI